MDKLKVRPFVLDRIEEIDTLAGYVQLTDLYAAYSEHATARGWAGMVVDPPSFSRALRALVPHAVPARTRINGHRETVFFGVRLKADV